MLSSRRVLLRAAVWSAVVVAVLSAFDTPPSWAQPVPSRDPSSTHIFPAGARRGARLAVQVGGECLPPGTELIFDGSHVKHSSTLERRVPDRGEPSPRRKPTEIPILYPKEWEAEVSIADDAPLGPVFWRLSCAQGGSGSRPFIIGDLPEFIERESNSQPERAQAIELPVTVNGQICGERDVDYFRVKLDAGQWVVCETLCRRLGSRLDPVIEWIGPGGAVLPAEELYFGGDRSIAVRASQAGEYLLRVANVSFEGSPAHVYRLTLTTVPLAIGATPSSLARGTEIEVQVLVFPTALQSTIPPRHVAASAEQTEVVLQSPEFRGTVTLPCDARRHVRLRATGAADSATRPVVELLTASPPNDASGSTNPSDASRATDTAVVIDGVLTRKAEPNSKSPSETPSTSQSQSFTLRIAKPATVSISAESTLTCDARIEFDVRDDKGQVILKSGPREALAGHAKLELPTSSTGDFTITVRPSQLVATVPPTVPYRIIVEPPATTLALSAAHDILNIRQGATAELEVTAERSGKVLGPIQITAESLPAGLTLEQAMIPANQRSAKIRFKAAEDVPSAPYVIRLTGRTDVDGRAIEAPVKTRHWGHDEEGASIGPSTLDDLHVTVQHKPIFRLQCAEAYQYAHRGSIYPYWMEIERLNEFDGPITFQLGDRQNRDLDGIEMLETTVSAAETRFAMPIYLPETMHINVQSQSQLYTQGFARFVDRHGRPQSVLVVSEKRNMLRTLPPVVRLDSADARVEWRSARSATCRLKLDRTSNFPGSMRLELVAGPAGLRIPGGGVEIPEQVSEIEVPLECDQDGRQLAGAIRFRATGAMSGDSMSGGVTSTGAQAVTETVLDLPTSAP